MAKTPVKRSSSGEISKFLRQSRQISTFVEKQPRLMFAIDATASRQPTWDIACQLQGEMFRATAALAALSVQLCYYRGLGEFHASPWLGDSEALASQMARVYCEGGRTQIGRLLRHARAEHGKRPVRAVVFIGDAMEEEADILCDLAGQCGLVKLPLFLFQEGRDRRVKQVFESMARLSGGAYARFDNASAKTLAELLGAVASYAAGGTRALEKVADPAARQLLEQLRQ